MNFKKYKLKNGVRLITVPIPESLTTTVMILTETGSKHESRRINGISHFLEHMCFKGTKKRPSSSAISSEFDSMGAVYNAFTGQEFTGYYAKAHPEYFSNILNIISDMYINPLIPKEELEKERGVILEEINMYEDMPQRYVGDLFMEVLYGDEPAGWGIAGRKEVVRSLKTSDFTNYHKKHYVAEGTIVVVAGRLKGNVKREVEKAMESIPNSKKPKKKKVKESQKSPNFKLKNKKTDQDHLMLGVRTFEASHKDIPTVMVMRSILSGGMSGRLFQKLRDEMGVAYYVRAIHDVFTDHGFLAVHAGVTKSRLQEVISVILDEFKKLRDEPISKEELKKAKDHLIGSTYINLDTSDSLAEFYVDQEFLTGNPINPRTLSSKIRKVKADDIQRVARKIVKNESLNIALISSRKSADFLKKTLSF